MFKVWRLRRYWELRAYKWAFLCVCLCELNCWNKVKCLASLTPSCSRLLCSHALQANSFCLGLHIAMLIEEFCLRLEFHKNSPLPQLKWAQIDFNLPNSNSSGLMVKSQILWQKGCFYSVVSQAKYSFTTSKFCLLSENGGIRKLLLLITYSMSKHKMYFHRDCEIF